MSIATQRLGVTREPILAAVDEMKVAGWIELQMSELVHGFRWLQRPETLDAVADSLHQRMLAREKEDIRRLDQVFVLTRAESCQAAQLLVRFGENHARSQLRHLPQYPLRGCNPTVIIDTLVITLASAA
jgi:ATP-dependent DNA helicase RecQ